MFFVDANPRLEAKILTVLKGLSGLSDSDLSGPFAPAWNLFRPGKLNEKLPENLVSEIANFMVEVFPAIRFVQANQASLEAVLPFLYFREYQLGVHVDPNSLFAQLFSSHRDLFAPMSKRTGLFGHYQLRRRHV